MNQPRPDIDPKSPDEIVPQPEPAQPQPLDPVPPSPQQLPIAPPIENPLPVNPELPPGPGDDPDP